jgi:RNA polymerase sigma-70 factor, ECF subfamily
MEKTFHELYEKYQNGLYKFIFYMTKNREQTEDLIQEVYVRVLKSYGNFDFRSSEKTWIYTIARNVTMDYFRKQKRWHSRILENFDFTKQQIESHSPLPEEILLMNETVQTMYRCMDNCTIDQRMVLILRYIQNLSISESSEVLGWTQAKVRTVQHRALKLLRGYMEKEKGVELREKIRMGK